MYTVGDIASVMEAWAPSAAAVPGDNVGLLCGRGNAPVARVMVALDVTPAVIREAAAAGAEMIVAHHPMFRDGQSRVTDGGAAGRLLLSLAESKIAALCMHTNLDAVAGGVNDCLAAALGLNLPGILNPVTGIGRWGDLPGPMTAEELARLAKNRTGACCVRYYDAGKPVRRLGICSGSGGSVLELAADSRCDGFLAGELKHSDYLAAAELGLNAVECGHFATENVISEPVAERLRRGLPGLETVISKCHKEPYLCL